MRFVRSLVVQVLRSHLNRGSIVPRVERHLPVRGPGRGLTREDECACVRALVCDSVCVECAPPARALVRGVWCVWGGGGGGGGLGVKR